MKKLTDRYRLGLLGASIVILAACGGSSSGTSDTTGFLSLGVSDGPIHDAAKVCITFDEIELKSDSSTTVIALDPPEKINLLDFQGANAAPILMNVEVTAGDYQWMRLGIDALQGSNGGMGDTLGVECDAEGSYIVMDDGTIYNLYVPSSANTGLKLVSGFTVPVNGSANFTAEWDLMKSITAPPGLSPDVLMKPVIRLVNNVEVGTLTGQVANALVEVQVEVDGVLQDCAASVYVFGDGITPNAIDDGEEPDPNDPVATALVEQQVNEDETIEYHYTVGFLSIGDYEVAYTCDGENFEPVDGLPANIAAGELTTVDFLAPEAQ